MDIQPIFNASIELDLLWNHLDVAAWTFLCTYTTALAVVVIELVSLARTQLNYSAVWADTVAVVTFHTVTAG